MAEISRIALGRLQLLHLETCIRRSIGLNTVYTNDNTTSGGLCVRHHQQYRGYFYPVKGTIDGSLILTFKTMRPEQQNDIANALNIKTAERKENETALSVTDIISRIDNTMRNVL